MLRPAGSPALTWLGGEKGVRDPHIVRDPRVDSTGHRFEHLLPWRLGGQTMAPRNDGSTGLGLPPTWSIVPPGGRGLEDSGRWHGGPGGELGSGSRAVDACLVHEEQRMKTHYLATSSASDECVLSDDR